MRSVLRRLLDQAGFSPRQLFAALQGAWLEPKQGLIWQENTGITPTTTGGQTIGLMLDQSQGAVLGPELAVNGGFAANITGWSPRGSATIAWDSSGAMQVNVTGSGGGFLSAAAVTMTAGKFYMVSIDARVDTAPVGAVVSVGMPFAVSLGTATLSSAYQTFRFTHLATGNAAIEIARSTAFTGTFLADNISVREILGNHAYQATAANRPLLGRRYNLLTYSEDFSNAAWDMRGGISTPLLSTPSPSGAAYSVLETATNEYHYPGRTSFVFSSASYTLSVTVKYNGRQYLSVAMNDGASKNTIFDILNGTKISENNSTGTITSLGGGWYRLATTAAMSNATGYVNFVLGTISSTNSYLGDISKGFYISAADLRLTSDVGKDPAYQRITTATDYDYGSYPAAIHDTNDSLSLSLPAINVRRNLLTYSEQFDNAAWNKQSGSVVTPNTALAPNGFATADFVVSNGTVGVLQAFISVPTNLPNTKSVYLRTASGTATVLLKDPNQTIVTTTCAVTTEWKRFALTETQTGGAAGLWIDDIPAAGIFIWGAQLELGSVATDYQKITDWTSEAFASSGSVYFATPVGMSQLNNQSMGTTYTLPALSSDIYSWMVFPQRLNAAQESRLARYMEQRAGIAGPDYFEQQDNGLELVSNGTFNTNYDGWTLQGTPTITVASGEVRIQSSTAGGLGLSQTISGLTIGEIYLVSATARVSVAGDTAGVQVNPGATTGVGYLNLTTLADTNQSLSGYFTASNTSVTLYLRRFSGANLDRSAYFDNISVRELKDGITGQLSDDAGDLIFTAQ